MGFDHDIGNSGLVLGLGFTSPASDETTFRSRSDNQKQVISPSILTLSLFGDEQESSGASIINVKREREIVVSEEVETIIDQRVSVTDEDEDGSNARKKLRLTKTQSALLEQSFKHHTTLNPKQKQELARNLNLRPRQVEVWFQNRRARTKLKQTEVDCEFLKKCCETLTDENRRLQKELQELKALKPLYMQVPATMCPSCQRITAETPPPPPKINGLKMGQTPHFYNPFFTNPSSAAC